MEPKIAQKLNDFFTRFTFQWYQKGELLISAGQDPKGIFFLEQGIVRQYGLSKQGSEMTLNIYKPLSFFPVMWALNHIPNTYYFEAMTDNVQVRIAPKEKVIAFLHTQPEILFDLLARVYKGVEGVFIHMQALLSGDAYSKLLSILLIATKRFGHEGDGGTKIELKLTENDLASYSGIQRETVSRLLQKLFKNHLLAREGDCLVITNIDKLEAELQIK